MKKYQLRHITSRVSDGNMSYRFGDDLAVTSNRRVFFERNNMVYDDSIWMSVQHGDRYQYVDQSHLGFGAQDHKTSLEADCLLTTEIDIPLALLTADCVPVILFSAEIPLIALVHLGWKNIDEYFIKKVLKQLVQKYGIETSNMQAFMGPHISSKSYCVSAPSQLDRVDWLPYIKKVETKFFIDIGSFAIHQLIDLGVPQKNISVSKIDTYTSEKYFSHKRSNLIGSDNGRFVTVAQLNAITF